MRASGHPERMQQAQYTATVTAGSGRVRSDDGSLDLGVTAPKELGGPDGGGDGTNAEQLLGAALAACYLQALGIGASTRGLDVASAEVTASVTIGVDGGPGWQSDVRLEVRGPEGTDDALVAAAAELCPFTKAFSAAGRLEVVRV